MKNNFLYALLLLCVSSLSGMNPDVTPPLPNNNRTIKIRQPSHRSHKSKKKDSLLLACHDKSIPRIEKILSDVIDINMQDHDGNTALHTIGRLYSNKEETIAHMLLEAGADPTITNKKGETAINFFDACANNMVSVVERLLEKNNNLINIHTQSSTPIHVAAFYGNIALLELFISKGANLNITDNNGYTPLHGAVAGKQNDVILFLIKYGLNIHQKGNRGGSPYDFMKTVGSHYNDMFELLSALEII